MTNVIDEFLVGIGYRVEGEAVLRESVRTATIQAKLLTDALEAMMRGFSHMFQNVSDNMEKMFYAAQRANMTVQQLRALGYAAKQTGSSLEEMAATGEALRVQLASNPWINRYIRNALHVNVEDKAEMDRVGGQVNAIGLGLARLRRVNEPAAMKVAEMLHYSMRQLDSYADEKLFMSRLRQDEEMARRIGIRPGDETQRNKFAESQHYLHQIVDTIWLKFESSFIERFGAMVTKFGDFLIAHGTEIGEALARIAGAILHVIMVVTKWFLAADQFISKTIGWENMIYIMAGALLYFITPLGSVIAAMGKLAALTLPGWLLAMMGVAGVAGVVAGVNQFSKGGAGGAGGAGEAEGSPGKEGPATTEEAPEDSHRIKWKGLDAMGKKLKEGGAKAATPAAPATPTTPGSGVGAGASPQLPFGAGTSPDVKNVDPRLLDLVNSGQAYLPAGHQAQIISGYGATHGDSGSRHRVKGSGALDIQIMDEQGHKIDNEGTDPTGMYHQFARGVYSTMLKKYPELKGRLAWGGAFPVSRGADLMHFDIGGERGRYADNWLSRMGPFDMAGDNAKRMRDLAAGAATTDASKQRMAQQRNDAATGGSDIPKQLDHHTTVTTHVSMKNSAKPDSIGDTPTDKQKSRHSLRYGNPASS